MKISHESPLALLDQYRYYNDYDYALVHLFESEPTYLQFFKDSLAQGRKVILDNSIFELGTAFDTVKFLHWIRDLKPTEYIIPDVLEDALGTINNANIWKNIFLPDVPRGIKSIGVVQGKTYQELVNCYLHLDTFVNVDKIAISFDYSYYLEVCPHPNKWMGYSIGRAQTLTRMLKEGIINRSKPHHLLGCSLPIEFMFYREGFEWIESMDTSNPVVHGLLNIPYEGTGLATKQSIKLVDLLHAKPTPLQENLIGTNVNKFKYIVRGMHEELDSAFQSNG